MAGMLVAEGGLGRIGWATVKEKHRGTLMPTDRMNLIIHLFLSLKAPLSSTCTSAPIPLIQIQPHPQRICRFVISAVAGGLWIYTGDLLCCVEASGLVSHLLIRLEVQHQTEQSDQITVPAQGLKRCPLGLPPSPPPLSPLPLVPLMSISCSSDNGWLFTGSVPFSAIYFSISRRS